MALIISWWGGNLRRRGRRVSGHYRAPETSKCIHRPAAKQQLHKHISSNLQYFGNSPKIHLYLKTLIDRKALVMMVKQRGWNGQQLFILKIQIPSTKKLKCSGVEMKFNFQTVWWSVINLFQNIFCCLAEVWSHLKYLVLFWSWC